MFSVPLRDASRGLMSKTSIPCILPRISNRSRPVDCSRSVGTVPGAPPGGRRSAALLISVVVRFHYQCPLLSYVVIVAGGIPHLRIS